MTERLLNNKRGLKNLICGENYIYSTLNKQGVYQYWRCLESARKQYSKNKEMLIFNLVSQYAQIADKQNYLQEVGGIMKL